MRIKHYALLFILQLMYLSKANAQTELTMYNMSGIAQVNQVNSSALPKASFYIGLPVLSSIHLLYGNNAFSYRELHTLSNDDSVFIDFNNVINKMKSLNCLTMQFKTDLISFGFRSGRNYFNANISDRIHLYFRYPGSLFQFLVEGNGKYIGQTLDFKKLGFDLTHFREYAFGFSRSINDKLTIGLRLKLLDGMENISSVNNGLTFTTDAIDYGLHSTTGFTINTSSLSKWNNNGGYHIDDFISGGQNHGFAGDISVLYKYNSKWEFNTSINDIGSIFWNNDVRNYSANANNYYFGGIDLKHFLSDSTNTIQNVIDSLKNTFVSTETVNAYKTNLPTQIYLSSRYNLNSKSSVSALLHGTVFQKGLFPSFTLGYQLALGKNVDFGTSWSIINNRADHFGLGISAKAGCLQLYAVTDNILGVIDPLSGHYTQLHFGLNLIFK